MYTTRRVEPQMQRIRDGPAAPRDLFALICGQYLSRGLHENGAKVVSLIH